jgi:hypothetical protein
MFNGGDQIKVRTNRSFNEVCDIVEDILEDLGPVHMTSSGRFSIDRGRQTATFTQVRYRGDIRERKDGGDFIIALDYEVAPSVTCWVLGIIGFLMCFFPGLLFLFPVLAKNDVERAANRALDDIDDELSR